MCTLKSMVKGINKNQCLIYITDKDCGLGGTCNPKTNQCDCRFCFKNNPYTGVCEGK